MMRGTTSFQAQVGRTVSAVAPRSPPSLLPQQPSTAASSPSKINFVPVAASTLALAEALLQWGYTSRNTPVPKKEDHGVVTPFSSDFVANHFSPAPVTSTEVSGFDATFVNAATNAQISGFSSETAKLLSVPMVTPFERSFNVEGPVTEIKGFDEGFVNNATNSTRSAQISGFNNKTIQLLSMPAPEVTGFDAGFANAATNNAQISGFSPETAELLTTPAVTPFERSLGVKMVEDPEVKGFDEGFANNVTSNVQISGFNDKTANLLSMSAEVTGFDIGFVSAVTNTHLSGFSNETVELLSTPASVAPFERILTTKILTENEVTGFDETFVKNVVTNAQISEVNNAVVLAPTGADGRTEIRTDKVLDTEANSDVLNAFLNDVEKMQTPQQRVESQNTGPAASLEEGRPVAVKPPLLEKPKVVFTLNRNSEDRTAAAPRKETVQSAVKVARAAATKDPEHQSTQVLNTFLADVKTMWRTN